MTTGFRPPATRNFKHDPPTKVVAERFKPARRYRLEQILDALPDPPVAPAARTATLMAPGRGEDALLAIAPAQYVQAHTGLRVGRDGKVRCPFHEDRTPSLHVYADPQRGWTCFGCGRGGSIFDLAAELDAITPRGAGFVALRERLEQRFGIAPPPGPRVGPFKARALLWRRLACLLRPVWHRRAVLFGLRHQSTTPQEGQAHEPLLSYLECDAGCEPRC